MDKIILIRTTHPESKLCSKLLKENQIKFGEIHSSSDKMPFLLIEGKAFSYRGLSKIRSYTQYCSGHALDKFIIFEN